MRGKVITMKKSVIATSIALALFSAPIFSEPAQVHAASYGVQEIGEGAKVIKRTEDAFSPQRGVTQNIQFDFIDDNKFNKDALIIKMQGHIQSRTQYRWFKNDISTGTAQMLWPSKYHIKFKTNDSNTDVVNFLPKNNIDSVDVSQTTGYNIGGTFDSGLSGGISGGYNYNKSISYNQQSYKSEVKEQSSKTVAWDVSANEFLKDGERYSAHDDLALVGWDPYSKNPRGFFWEDTEQPVLIKSGFNPSFITTVSREKDSNNPTSTFEITYGRTFDLTNAIRKYTFSGISYLGGYHQAEVYKNKNYTVKYEVNWNTHEVKIIN